MFMCSTLVVGAAALGLFCLGPLGALAQQQYDYVSWPGREVVLGDTTQQLCVPFGIRGQYIPSSSGNSFRFQVGGYDSSNAGSAVSSGRGDCVGRQGWWTAFSMPTTGYSAFRFTISSNTPSCQSTVDILMAVTDTESMAVYSTPQCRPGGHPWPLNPNVRVTVLGLPQTAAPSMVPSLTTAIPTTSPPVTVSGGGGGGQSTTSTTVSTSFGGGGGESSPPSPGADSTVLSTTAQPSSNSPVGGVGTGGSECTCPTGSPSVVTIADAGGLGLGDGLFSSTPLPLNRVYDGGNCIETSSALFIIPWVLIVIAFCVGYCIAYWYHNKQQENHQPPNPDSEMDRSTRLNPIYEPEIGSSPNPKNDESYLTVEAT